MSPAQPLTALATRARTRSDAIVARVASAFRAEIPGYRPGEGLTDEDIRGNIDQYLDEILERIGGGAAPGPAKLDAFMRSRLDAGITLTSLLYAYRLGAAVIWDALAALARANQKQKDALIAATPALFELLNTYSVRAHAIYREIEIRDARRKEQIRAALLDTVLSEDSSVGADFWNAVATLGIPRTGQFAIVVAMTDTDQAAGDAPADIEALVASHAAVEDAWFRLSPRMQLGLVSFRRNRIAALDDVTGKVSRRVPVRIGVSSPFTSVAVCSTARIQAQVAAAATSTARRTIRYNRDVLPVLMASAPDAAATVVATTLGPVLALPLERRDALIETVRTWLELRQSVSATATALHCHRNTVNYRLRRFAELAGGSLADNVWLAQVVLSIEAPLPNPAL